MQSIVQTQPHVRNLIVTSTIQTKNSLFQYLTLVLNFTLFYCKFIHHKKPSDM